MAYKKNDLTSTTIGILFVALAHCELVDLGGILRTPILFTYHSLVVYRLITTWFSTGSEYEGMHFRIKW